MHSELTLSDNLTSTSCIMYDFGEARLITAALFQLITLVCYVSAAPCEIQECTCKPLITYEQANLSVITHIVSIITCKIILAIRVN